MSSLKQIYEREAASEGTACAFLSMVADKVERLDRLYTALGETSPEMPPQPASDKIKQRYRDPLTCGGVYYKNKGSPCSAVQPLDDCGLADDASARRDPCLQKVSGCSMYGSGA